ncbi:CPBP family intramembrane glutamic endopeptidase, partial [Acinetobacter baumannii]
MWGVLSLSAGLGEEVAYRGALFLTLTWWIGNQWIALVIVAAVFALAHVRQGLRATAFIFGFGALMQLLVMV